MTKGANTCGGENEILRKVKVDKDEGRCGAVRGWGVIDRTDEFLVGYSGGRVVVQIALLMEFDLKLVWFKTSFWFNDIVISCF